MSESTPSTAGLEDLLERRLPSAIARHDASLEAAGITSQDVASTKDAIASLGLLAPKAEPPSPSLRDRLLASRQRKGKFGIFADRIARMFDLPLAEAETLMQKIEQPDAWNPFLVEGVEMIPVMAGSKCEGAIATLVRIKPGSTFPHHTHRGEETMIVLDGGFREPGKDGEEVWRGDEILRGDGSDHELAALPGVPCIAAVLIFGHGDF